MLVGVFCVVLVYALVKTLFRESIEAYENSAFRRVADGKRNPRRIRDAFLQARRERRPVVIGIPFASKVAVVALFGREGVAGSAGNDRDY